MRILELHSLLLPVVKPATWIWAIWIILLFSKEQTSVDVAMTGFINIMVMIFDLLWYNNENDVCDKTCLLYLHCAFPVNNNGKFNRPSWVSSLITFILLQWEVAASLFIKILKVKGFKTCTCNYAKANRLPFTHTYSQKLKESWITKIAPPVSICSGLELIPLEAMFYKDDDVLQPCIA